MFVAPLCLDPVLLWQNGDGGDISGSGGSGNANGAIGGDGDVSGAVGRDGNVNGEIGSNLPYMCISMVFRTNSVYVCI